MSDEHKKKKKDTSLLSLKIARTNPVVETATDQKLKKLIFQQGSKRKARANVKSTNKSSQSLTTTVGGVSSITAKSSTQPLNGPPPRSLAALGKAPLKTKNEILRKRPSSTSSWIKVPPSKTSTGPSRSRGTDHIIKKRKVASSIPSTLLKPSLPRYTNQDGTPRPQESSNQQLTTNPSLNGSLASVEETSLPGSVDATQSNQMDGNEAIHHEETATSGLNEKSICNMSRADPQVLSDVTNQSKPEHVETQQEQSVSLSHTRTTSLSLCVKAVRQPPRTVRRMAAVDSRRHGWNAVLAPSTTKETPHLTEAENQDQAPFSSQSPPTKPRGRSRDPEARVARPAALEPIPMAGDDRASTNDRRNNKGAASDNFVKLNLRNKAGSCLGAKNKKTLRKFRGTAENHKVDRNDDKEDVVFRPSSSHDGALASDGIDLVDDLVDGTFHSSSKKSRNANPLPLCSGHSQPCKQLTVKKNSSGNKGRQFYCCAMNRGEQCDFFQWVDDTVEKVHDALAKNQSYSAFVARQVQSYMESVKVLTVPELRDLAKRHGLRSVGNKKQLLMRLTLWARDELVHSSCSSSSSSQETTMTIKDASSKDNDDDDTMELSLDASDDSSTSSEELELVGETPVSDNEAPSSERVVRERDDKDPVASGKQGNSLVSSLKHYFGYTSFRTGQEWAIRRCLDGKRSMLVAPTGSGKSLCYALPAALMPGICIVVSPLLALIQDQIRVLPPSIPCVTLSGQMSKAKMAATVDDIARGRIKIVFVSPEKLISAAFRRLFVPQWNRETKRRERHFPDVSLLCVDEAHCLSQWAHNFRPAYLRLGSTVDVIRPKSILAITATAGPRVISDVCSSLGIESLTERPGAPPCLDNGGVLLMDSNRDNIEVSCEVLGSQEERLARLKALLKPRGDTKKPRESWEGCLASGSVIVYVWRRGDAEAVAENIQSSGIEGGVVCYHGTYVISHGGAGHGVLWCLTVAAFVPTGGMDSGARARAQSKFIRGKARICVATVAFGLGINKADIEGVIHLYLSSSLEHYLQEIGRAGRDGRQAIAVSLVLKDEVLVRHSLAHSDMIAMSQVQNLVSLISSKIKSALSVMTDKPDQLCIGLNLHDSTLLCGCKAETVETMVSLLEAPFGTGLLRLDGFVYDKATVSPGRGDIEELSKNEDVIKAVQSCSVRRQPGAGDVRSNHTSMSDESNSIKDEHAFGSFHFSITQCANALGPDAEPRHVFAALRRLQQKREVEFALDTIKGGALNVRVFQCGISQFVNDNAVEQLSKHLFNKFQQSTNSSAEKALRIDHILNQVAATCAPSPICGNKKSETLALFQQLTREYFDLDNESHQSSHTEILRNGTFDEPPHSNALSADLEPVIQFLHHTEQGNHSTCDRMTRPQQDLTSLNATKFLHGIAPFHTDLRLCRQHHLFGKYQTVMFSKLKHHVDNILAKSL